MEKGSGFVRVLHGKNPQGAVIGRIVVRMKGVLRVLLNTPVIARDGVQEGLKSVKFQAMEENAICWYRVNLLQENQQEDFLKAIASVDEAPLAQP